jgi:D-sedoheptulose 7-phosphate isomerase
LPARTLLPVLLPDNVPAAAALIKKNERTNKMSHIDLIKKRFQESLDVKQKSALLFPELIEKANNEIVKRLRKGCKIVTCGNGGSSCDAQHIATELLVRFYINRAPIPAITLETNTAALTAIANDFSYEESFSKGAQALLQKNDVLLALSTSGNSPNILKAIEAAKQKGAWILGFSGKTGGKMAALCDLIFLVPSADTPRIQEVHITIAHILCELIEADLFG